MFSKQTIVRIEKIKNCIFETFKNSKWPQKHPKPKFKKSNNQMNNSEKRL